jgi:hypothetical protein
LTVTPAVRWQAERQRIRYCKLALPVEASRTPLRLAFPACARSMINLGGPDAACEAAMEVFARSRDERRKGLATAQWWLEAPGGASLLFVLAR